MAEKFVDTLGEKVMVVITVEKSPKIAGKYKSIRKDTFVHKQSASATNTWSSHLQLMHMMLYMCWAL